MFVEVRFWLVFNVFLVLLLLCTSFSVECVSKNNTEGRTSSWSYFYGRKFVLDATDFLLADLQPECKVALESVLKLASEGDLSALKMLDANAKLPSGILSGNINQYGDFDECMEVKWAQYCLAEIDLERVWRHPYSKYKNLVHSYFPFRDSFNDPAHRLPGFKMVRWGFCIPNECTPKDLQHFLGRNFDMSANIRSGMCQKSSKETMHSATLGERITRVIFVTLLLAISLSTMIDVHDRWREKYRSQKNKLVRALMCFSLKANAAKLFEIKEDDNRSTEILSLHGVRSLSAFALLMSHKSVTLLYNPYVNRTAMIQTLAKPWTIIAKNAIIYTDCFMLLSGLLNANSLLTDVLRCKSMKFGEKFINRLFRILPNFGAIILFCTYVLPSLGSGPLWPTVVDHHSVLCKKYMWRNFLFIHNYFGFEKMCLTHTHQLGIDMQLFVITPILIYFVSKSKLFGLSFLVVVAIASTILRYWIIYANELSSVVYFGISIEKMFQMADLSYILPTHRATIYVIGVFLACMLRLTKPRFWSKTQQIVLWIFFLGLFFLTWLGPFHMARENYVYNREEAALIAAFTPILFGGTIAMAIYAINIDLGAWLTNLLCWKYFQFGTKIAYSLYLVQFPIFFYNVGQTKHVDEYKPYFLLQVLETSVIVLASIVLTLFVEMPFQNVRRVLFTKPDPAVFKEDKAENSNGLRIRKSKLG